MVDKHNKTKSFVYIWQYNANKANKVNKDILKDPLLESHLHILQNNKGFLYYIGIHEGNNIRYAHSSNTVEALGLPNEVDYDNLPPGWKRRKIFIGETYPQVQAMESKLLKKAYYDHDWNRYLNKAWWDNGHLFGGAGEDNPGYKHGLRGGKNRYDPEVESAYRRELRRENKKKQIEEATPPFDKSILRYLYVSESVYLPKDKLI